MPTLEVQCGSGWLPAVSPVTVEFAAGLRDEILVECLEKFWGHNVYTGGLGVMFVPQDAQNRYISDIRFVLHALYRRNRADALNVMLREVHARLGPLLRDLMVPIADRRRKPSVSFNVAFDFGGGFQLETGNAWDSELPGAPINAGRIWRMLDQIRGQGDSPRAQWNAITRLSSCIAELTGPRPN